jgi:hypothetical protein
MESYFTFLVLLLLWRFGCCSWTLDLVASTFSIVFYISLYIYIYPYYTIRYGLEREELDWEIVRMYPGTEVGLRQDNELCSP